MNEQNTQLNPTEIAAEMTIAWLANSNTRASSTDAIEFLSNVRGAIQSLEDGGNGADGEQEASSTEYTPAVSVRKSLASKDHIVSMIDGKPYKMLRRHLSTHGLTPEQYRERYNLRSDYPMVSENYSQARRKLAKDIGLGKKR